MKPIGIFDSGYGGLTVLKDIEKKLPQYDYLYLGDNARAPYGNRSFETVFEYTWECVQWFFHRGCDFVILACNTASAKALRNIQQNYLPKYFPDKKVLGVLRPTTEIIGNFTKSKTLGILGTKGTVTSKSYEIEIQKFFPEIEVHSMACPMFVPIIENNEIESPACDYFIKKYVDQLIQKNNSIDTILLACTHYPIIKNKIENYAKKITVIAQGEIVANSLEKYLQLHTEIEYNLSKNGNRVFYTTDDTEDFNKTAHIFIEREIQSLHANIVI